MKAAIAFICCLPLVALAGKDETPIPDSCPVTRATAETRYAPPPPVRPDAADSPRFWYGSDELYTNLAADGRWRGMKSASGIREKSIWFRKDAQWLDEVPHQLRVTFRPLGKAGSMFTVPRVTNAIIGKEVAMLLMLEFPTPGCWEVTANYKDAHASFVTWVD